MLTTNQIGCIAKSKREMYRFLQSEADIYLPPILEANYRYIRDAMKGDKKYILANKVKIKSIPQVDNLKVKDILMFARREVDIDKFMPDYHPGKLPDRHFYEISVRSFWGCFDLVNSLIPDKLDKFVNKKLEERRQRMVTQRDMEVDMLPEFVKAFKRTNHISYENGISHILLRKSRRSAKIEEEKHEIETPVHNLKSENKNLIETINQLQEEVEILEKSRDKNEENKSILSELYKKGIINSEGAILE